MLDSSRLGAAIVARLKADGLYPTDADAGQSGKSVTQWTAIADEILKELKSHAEIVPGTLAAAAGIAVQVSTSTGLGSTIAPGPIVNIGKIT